MPDSPLLQTGDNGPGVAEAQGLLNRGGAMLTTDGAFGPGTAAAVKEFQTRAGLPVTGQIDDDTWQALRALPEPSPDIPTQAVTFICTEETGGRSYYDRVACRPVWPGGASGVTIGVGYDLGQQTTFAADWAGVLSQDQIDALMPWVGVKGQAAQPGPAQLQNIVIPWHDAWQVFIRQSLPTHVDLTKDAFAGCTALPPLSLGMLVSLVYNRGGSMNDSPAGSDNRLEMRNIEADIRANNFADIPAQFRAMKRLWPDSPGLQARRDAEAALFEQGLGAA